MFACYVYFKELTLTIKKFFVGLSILQNGRMPQFLSEEQLQEVFGSFHANSDNAPQVTTSDFVEKIPEETTWCQ